MSLVTQPLLYLRGALDTFPVRTGMLAVKFDTDLLPPRLDEDFALIRHHGRWNTRGAVKAINEDLNLGNIDKVL
jgi:hypothetical protein